jgi:hypothetical protein
MDGKVFQRTLADAAFTANTSAAVFRRLLSKGFVPFPKEKSLFDAAINKIPRECCGKSPGI